MENEKYDDSDDDDDDDDDNQTEKNYFYNDRVLYTASLNEMMLPSVLNALYFMLSISNVLYIQSHHIAPEHTVER